MSVRVISRYLLGYKIAVLASGLVPIVLGYFLYDHGVFGPTNDLTVEKGLMALTLRAGPGIFLAFFGSCIIGITLYRGFRLESAETEGAKDQDNKLKDNDAYDVVKHWFDESCMCIKRLEEEGKLSEEDSAEFDRYTANLADAITSLAGKNTVRSNTGRESRTSGLASA